MIVYLASRTEFLDDVLSNRIEEKILHALKTKTGRGVGPSEIASWKNSLGYMDRIFSDQSIPTDVGIAIEFKIPSSAKRIDFIASGRDAQGCSTIIIVELKQWSKVQATEKDAIVSTFVSGAEREMTHPSYQAWSYAALLEDFNEAVRQHPVRLWPCAYLHNCTDATILDSAFYKPHTAKAPLFLKDDARKLREYIKERVKTGDSGEALFVLRDGKIRPSKSLADSLSSMLQGNAEFTLIDDQKLVYETALNRAEKAMYGSKQVLIVDGGPGTGKSVVAINLLAELTARGKLVRYVTKNAAPRAVFESKLTGTFTKSRIGNLFTGSGAYTDTGTDSLDVLVVDEAHRLNEKSGMFGNLGENQIKELINTARATIFFLDEDQRVTFKDIGEGATLMQWAASAGAEVTRMALQSQFRCNGSDGYLSWVDDVLQIRETGNTTLEGIPYDFRVYDSAGALQREIVERNRERNNARTVAGYCWDWKSKSNPKSMDIVLDGGFAAKWNLASDGSLWILKSDSVSEVGCIHTCQGLEVDYIGVIIGPDLVVRDGKVVTDASKRSRMDSSVKGYKTLLKSDPKEARRRADMIIKNTYRTLLTRGQKGCFVHSTDAETNEYFRARSDVSTYSVLEAYAG